MARDSSDPWRRLREREDEEENNEELSLFQRRTAGAAPTEGARTANPALRPQGPTAGDKLETLIDQAKSSIDQLNALYRMYLAGVETRPPNERRKLLEKSMEQILAAPKATQSMNFKVSSLQATYNIHKDLWDRQLRDLEMGKISRRARPSGG